MGPERSAAHNDGRVPLRTIAREWTRLGYTGFGGPPTHILLLRRLCVEERRWLNSKEFEDAIATTNLLPGPASTQLAIYCAWKLRGPLGGVLGGLCFICPGLILIIALSALFLAKHPPIGVLGAAAGAGALTTAPVGWLRGRRRRGRGVVRRVPRDRTHRVRRV